MADTVCAGIIPNPDLVGIGTRFNFYVTIFLAALIPQHKHTTELLDSIYTNTMYYGLALVITVLVQTIQGQLDLYHAIFVMHMLVCFEILHGYGIIRYILDRNIDFKLKITIAVSVFQLSGVFNPWALYVWIKDPRFGSQPECNDLIKYVVLFVNIRATSGWLRIVAIFAFGMSILISLVGLVMVFKLKMRRRQSPEASPPFSWVDWGSSIVFSAYAIVTTELVVHRNRQHVQVGEDSWGFGQIVSIILILPIIIEILASLRKWNSRGSEENAVRLSGIRSQASPSIGPETQSEPQSMEMMGLIIGD